MFKKKIRILYLAAADYTGTMNMFVQEHRARGHKADFVTLSKSAEGFDNGLCLDLRPNGKDKAIIALRNLISENSTFNGERELLPGTPPFSSPSKLRQLANRFQDIYYGRHINNFIKKHNLLDYDIYHLEGGIDFFKDYRILPKLKAAGKILIANYHGNDFRNRGVHPVMHQLADANMTCEWDIHFRYPGSHYLFLPMKKIESLNRQTNDGDTIVICHLVRNEQLFYYKGSKKIKEITERVIKGRNAEFRLLCGLKHEQALLELSKAHILIDQIGGGKGGYGYGMSAVEALSLGLNVCVEIQPEMKSALGSHPFVEVDEFSLEANLTALLDNPQERKVRSLQGPQWVKSTHSISSITDKLYQIYHDIMRSKAHFTDYI